MRFFVPQADHYIIKTSENLLDLRNNFDRATSVNCSNLIPKEAGREESFEIQPENKTENGTKIYFAICAVDDTNLISEVSNHMVPSSKSICAFKSSRQH